MQGIKKATIELGEEAHKYKSSVMLCKNKCLS